jgi:Na+/H+ antiporter NhaD/arsenite permease-like protein
LGAAVFSVGGVSLLLGNLMNNQPMTILMTRVLLSGTYEEGVPDPRVRQGAAFALVVASNLAANFTLLGSLAGIMWVSILRRQGLPGFGYLQFLRLMAPVGLACSAATLLVLWAQLAGFP